MLIMITSSFSEPLSWQTLGIAFGGHQCSVAAGSRCTGGEGQAVSAPLLSHSSVSQRPELRQTSFKEGLHREREKPKSKHGFAETPAELPQLL